jgi:hypothetical protein
MPGWLIHPLIETVAVAAACLAAWRLLARDRARLIALALLLTLFTIGNPVRLVRLEPFLWAALVSIAGYIGLFALAGWLVHSARDRLGPAAPFALLPLFLYPFALFAAALFAYALKR